MPLHDYRCSRGHVSEAFQSVMGPKLEAIICPYCPEGNLLATKVFLSAPMVRGDLPGYDSPIDGRWVEGRAARREDLRRNGCREYDPSERTEFMRRKAAEDAKLERSIEDTIEGEISRMPARKKELLEQEVRAGASADVIRRTPT